MFEHRKTRVYSYRSPYRGCVELYISRTESQTFSTVEPVEFVEIEEGTTGPPALTLTEDEAQEMFDSLWDQGFRPKNNEGNIGALSATQAHLEDMRTLVFKGD